MSNSSRYARGLKDLKGVAQQLARDRIFKRNPPFLQAQIEYTVKDHEVIKQPPFVEGDRVQIVSGPDQGKIGKIHAIYKDGNCAFVEGLGGSKEMVLPRIMWLEGQSTPVAKVPNPIPYDNMRVVSQIKNDDGTIEDVAVHSITFQGAYFDKERNKMMPIRRAKHDPSIIIPYPLPPNPIEPSKSDLATSAEEAKATTFIPPSITTSPVLAAALDQIRNPHSKFKLDKRSRKITADEASLWSPPSMPIPPKTKKLLAQLEQMPKRPEVEFTPEIEAYINSEVQKGLQRRISEETSALEKYK